MRYSWLSDILIEWGTQYPAYFDATLGQNLQACALFFWAIVLWALMHPRKERKEK
jgi:hypothetical protein